METSKASAWRDTDLLKRIVFTILALLIFRLGCVIPVPFIDSSVLNMVFNKSSSMLNYMNIMSGGALGTSAFFALGVLPYINSSIIFELLAVIFPSLDKMRKEGNGSQKFEKYSRYLGAVLALVMAIGYYFMLKNFGALTYNTGWFGALAGVTITLILTVGAQISVWLGSLIDEKGIGSGVSLIIFAGIVSRWNSIYTTSKAAIEAAKKGDVKQVILPICVLLFVVVSIIYVSYMTGSERKVPVVYATARHEDSKESFIPMKLIAGGVMPIIFANTVLSIPATITLFMKPESHPQAYKYLSEFGAENWLYCVLYVLFIFLFNYFYISIQFDPVEVANNLRKANGTIPGVRPGKDTADFLEKAMNHLAPAGSITLVLIAVLPIVIGKATHIQIQFGGTSLLIISGVVLEVMKNIHSYILVKTNTGFLAEPKKQNKHEKGETVV